MVQYKLIPSHHCFTVSTNNMEQSRRTLNILFTIYYTIIIYHKFNKSKYMHALVVGVFIILSSSRSSSVVADSSFDDLVAT